MAEYEYRQLTQHDEASDEASSDEADDVWVEGDQMQILNTPNKRTASQESPKGGLQTCAIALTVVVLTAALTGGCLALTWTATAKGHKYPSYSELCTGISEGLVDNAPEASATPLGNYSHAAVSVDGEPCAQIGVSVLQRNGTAVDAAIATLLCNGLINPQSMGLGGGFLMTVYQDGKAYSLSARERAPLDAHLDMYGDDENGPRRGALSVAVPGEVAGYWKAKQEFGNPDITWESLFQPAIDMCRDGIPVLATLEHKLKEHESVIRNDPGLREMFIDPKTDQPLPQGDHYYNPILADTLEKIAKNGATEFYEGETGQNLLRDLREAGGIITHKDLKQYKALMTPAVSVDIGGHMVHSVPPPGSGVILTAILNIMEHFHVKPSDRDSPLLAHRMIEAFKWAYAARSKLGDPEDEDIEASVNELVDELTSEAWAEMAFSKIDDSRTFNETSYYGGSFAVANDHGTAHVSVLAPNGDAVAVTSTVNILFGSGFLSNSTGILLNDQMDDFSYPSFTNYFGLPPSEANFMKPGKRPMSSMCPTIVVDKKGHVQLALGAAGGSKITTAVALTTLRTLWLKEDIKTAIDSRRFHHQLLPMTVEYEDSTTKSLASFLCDRGHSLEKVEGVGSVVCAVHRDGARGQHRIYANADWRKSGGVDGY